jgi:hypothetical protein
MNLQTAHNQLEAQGQAILALLVGLSADDARWKPAQNSWSVLEVLSHLVDEEIHDFRAHLDHILHTPKQPWPEIDPIGWVTKRHYNEGNFEKTRIRFETEREKSLSWLLELDSPDWEATVIHSWGTLSAGDMLASWLAHDLLHLRQLVELRYLITAIASQPFQLDYAGKW